MALAAIPGSGHSVAVGPSDAALAALGALCWAGLLLVHLAPAGHAPHAGGGGPGPPSPLVVWALMVGATMAPAAVALARHVAGNSLRWRRRRAVVLAVSAQLGLWVLLGLPVVALVGTSNSLEAPHRRALLVAGLLVVAALWHVAPARRRAVVGRGRSRPLPLRGRRAELASVAIGLRHGIGCVASCGPLMLPMAVATGSLHLALTAGATALVVLERVVGIGAAGRVRAAGGIAVAAVAAAATAFAG